MVLPGSREQTGEVNRSQTTQGATMVLVVLLTMMLLAGLLAASSQLTLSSRRTTSAQAASLRAQYVAESGMALAQERLREVQTLLTTENMNVTGATGSILKNYAEKFCGFTNWNSSTDVNGNTIQTCNAMNNTMVDQFDIFVQYVVSYDSLPPGERPKTTDAKRVWWKDQLGQPQRIISNGATINYRIMPEKVVRRNTESYRFYLKLQDVNVIGQSNDGATRALKAFKTQYIGWWIDINVPPFLDNVLFTNHHRSSDSGGRTPNVTFNDQIFDGPVHTNEKFRFYTNSTAKFKGKLSSAGCTDLGDVVSSSFMDCSREAGYYYNTNKRSPKSLTASNEEKNISLLSKLDDDTDVEISRMKNPDGTDSDKRKANFTANYRPLPSNANDQRAASKGEKPPSKTGEMDDPIKTQKYVSGKGLYFGSDIKGMEMFAGNELGEYPAKYDAVSKVWSPTPVYQYITVTKKQDANCKSNCKTTTEEYRINSSNQIFRKSSGVWPATAEPKIFNGAIFVDGALEGLSGPPRATIGGVSRPRPALAPFSQITVSADKSIGIAGELVLSDVPCLPSETDCIRSNKTSPKNVLGVFTQTGDVEIIRQDTYKDINLHAMLMTSQGEVKVLKHDSGNDRGVVNLIGGLVENWYGAFGTVSNTGYGRNFSHDRRFEDPGFAPPFFPESPTWQMEDSTEELTLDGFGIMQTSQEDLEAIP